ncbi:MAG: hypothetical protein KDC87_16325, partial [Planctomycetes bacterium]|nr:hypothetical protein [Planctomycetota bacterium]
VRPPVAPSGRMVHAMAYDGVGQRALLFGGMIPISIVATQIYGDTWAWDGSTWVEVTPANGPSPRSGHAMVRDAARDRVVLFGGQAANGANLAETWEWDGATWSLVPATPSPPVRFGHQLAYDAARQRVVMFGGFGNGGTRLGDVWEWDGVAWTDVTPAAGPPARAYHAMAYDPARQRTLLFGGYGTATLGDTWEWDGANWAERKPSLSPPPCAYHDLAYDVVRRRTVLFTGIETWEWDGASWARLTPTRSPAIRRYFKMAYDAARLRTVLFGGFGTQTFDDTWEWDGATWTQLPRTILLTPRSAHVMAYDSARGMTVLFAGEGAGSSHGGPFFNDTWELRRARSTVVATPATLALAVGGTQTLSIDAGIAGANQLYWVVGSITGTIPGVVLTGTHIPLQLDAYTDITLVAANSPPLSGFRGTLDATGAGAAVLRVPAMLPVPSGFRIFHSAIVFDATTSQVLLATNPAVLVLR